jgi:hypothetical protein
MSDFKVGDLVMFKNKAQNCTSGMEIEEVDSNMFDTLLKVKGLWWTPGCFQPFEEWQKKYQRF